MTTSFETYNALGIIKGPIFIQAGYPPPLLKQSSPQLWPGSIQRSFKVRRTPITSSHVKRTVLKGKPGGPRCMTWRTEGDRLLCGLASGEVAAYSAASLECDDLKRILAATGEITAMTALRGFDFLIFGDSSGKLHFARRNFAPEKTMSIYNQPNAVYAIEPNPTDAVATVAVKAAMPALVDLTRFQAIGLFKGLGFETSCVSWHPRRQLVAAGSRTSQVQLWDPRDTSSGTSEAQNSAVVAASFAHRGSLQAIKWHPFNDFKLLTCAKDQLICLWDIRQPTQSTKEAWVPIQVVKAEPLEVGSETNKCPHCLQTADAANFYRTGDLDLPRTQPTCMDWHPWDGELFVVGDSLGMLSFYREGELLCRVDQTLARQSSTWVPTSAVEAVKFHPSGNLLASTGGASAGHNGTVNFWAQPQIWGPLAEAGCCAHAVHLSRKEDEEERKHIKHLERKRRTSLIVKADSILTPEQQPNAP